MDPLASSPPSPRRPSPGCVPVALRNSSVATVRSTLGHLPRFEALLARAEPYRVAAARGVIVHDAPITELHEVIAEIVSARSRLEATIGEGAKIGDAVAMLRDAARADRMAPRPERHNVTFASAHATAGRRSARWRRAAEAEVFRWALTDRFMAAVAASPASMRWSFRAAYRLMGLEVAPPPYLAILPAGALLWNPVPRHTIPAPGADAAALDALFAELVHLPLVADLAGLGYLAAGEAMTWLTTFATRCCCSLDDAAPERAAHHARAQAALAAYLARHTVEPSPA